MQRHLFRLVVRRGCIAMIKGKWQVSADRMTTTAFPLDGKRACPLVYCGHVWRERREQEMAVHFPHCPARRRQFAGQLRGTWH